MPIDFEDSGAGAGFTGDPDPVRPLSRKQMEGAQKQKVNQTSRGPEVPQGDGTSGRGEGKALPGDEKVQGDRGEGANPLQQLGAAAQKGDQAVRAERPFHNLNPFAPVDWPKMAVNQASDVYHWGRGAYQVFGAFLDQDALHRSVAEVWNQDSAASRVMQFGLQGPGGMLQPHQLQQQGAENVLPVAATAGANPLTYLGAGATDVPRMLAYFAGPSVMEAILSSNPDDQAAGMTWAALTGALIGGTHLPAPVRQQLARMVGRWPETEQLLKGIVSGRNSKAAAVQDPLQNTVKDWIDEQLSRGGFPGSEVTLARGLKAGAQQLGVAQQTAEGNIVVSGKELAKQQRAVLKRLGVESVDELVSKAQEQPITGKAAKIIAENWKTLGLPYDLQGVYRADDPLRDPRRPLLEIHNAGDDAAQSKAHDALSLTHHYLDQIHRGPFANEERPLVSLWRSLIGNQRATDVVDEGWRTALAALGEHAGLDGTQLSRAIEGDQEIYQSLPAEGRLIVDATRLVTNGLRDASKGTGYAENFVGNWLPRLDRFSKEERAARSAKARSGSGVLVGETRKHRTAAIAADEAGRLVAGQAYETIGETNRAIKAERDAFLAHVLNPVEGLRSGLRGDPEIEAIRKLVATDPETARRMALDEAARRFKPKEDDFFKILGRGAFGRQANAVHSHMAIHHLLDQQIGVKDPVTGNDVLKKAAVRLSQDPRQNKSYSDLGYRSVSLPHFSNVLVHPEFAELLDKAVTHQGAAGAKGVMRGALELERRAIQMIMYSPAIHGLNVAGRLGMFAMHSPMRTLSYLLGRGTEHERNAIDFGHSLRREAYNAGVMPHSHGKSGMVDLSRSLGNTLGDPTLAEVPELADQGEGFASGPLGQLVNVGKALPTGMSHLQNWFWGKVNDFGVMAYHVEKQAALARGVDPITASLHAANRANTWMGMVRPEDTNPLTHQIARSVFFAPSWWRTWAQLFIPYYSRAGYEVSPELARHMALSEAKVVYAAYGFQKMTGNTFNYMLSGHLQNQNLPGNQDRLEIQNPDIIRFLQQTGYPGAAKIDPETGVDPATGGRLTLENPLARQQLATETAAGFESGQPESPTLEDVESGGADVLVNRLSPLMEALGASANLDIYRTVHDKQLRSINPERPAFEPDAASPLFALLYASPFGTQVASQIQRDVQQGKSPLEMTDLGIGGLKVPRAVAEVAGGRRGLRDYLVSFLTGVNPPYEYSARTRGTTPADQDYRNLQQIQQGYQQEMSALSAQSLGGQITPNQWLTTYRTQSARHSASVAAIFKNAPQYAQGTDALVSQYEGLYDQASVNGVLDPSTLEHLQGQFRASHSAAELNAMDAELAKNDQKYPMLALYHKTTKAYLSWQERWASQHGYDVGSIRSEARQYGALYSNQQAANRYIAQHPDLRAYEQAKRREFEQSPAGLMYGLFYDSSTVARYMQAHHLSAQQVEQEVMAS